jgi:hypothetical protein
MKVACSFSKRGALSALMYGMTLLTTVVGVALRARGSCGPGCEMSAEQPRPMRGAVEVNCAAAAYQRFGTQMLRARELDRQRSGEFSTVVRRKLHAAPLHVHGDPAGQWAAVSGRSVPVLMSDAG